MNKVVTVVDRWIPQGLRPIAGPINGNNSPNKDSKQIDNEAKNQESLRWKSFEISTRDIGTNTDDSDSALLLNEKISQPDGEANETTTTQLSAIGKSRQSSLCMDVEYYHYESIVCTDTTDL